MTLTTDIAEAIKCAGSDPQVLAEIAVRVMQEQSFQSRVQPWLMECFGAKISADKQERNHRFLEEALELVQACGCTDSEAHQLVDYVYGRPQGDINQEVGDVMVTLAAHCLAHGVDMHDAGETELARVWTKVEKIRAKQAAKPKHSPLPMQERQSKGFEKWYNNKYISSNGQFILSGSYHDNLKAAYAAGHPAQVKGGGVMGITNDEIADLSPNMRKVLRECACSKIASNDTYWITLQGLASRGLVTRPRERKGYYCLTALGEAYRAAVKSWYEAKKTP